MERVRFTRITKVLEGGEVAGNQADKFTGRAGVPALADPSFVSRHFSKGRKPHATTIHSNLDG